MKEFTRYTSISESLKILDENVVMTPRAEVLSVLAAFQRILYSDVIAKSNIPPFDASHMDGFAVLSEDVKSASQSDPVRLRLKKGGAVGKIPLRELRRGEAHGILTGGFLPRYADAVVPLERAEVDGGEVVVRERFAPGSYVYRSGSDVKKGEVILAKGTELRPQEIGLLASLHVGRVRVYRKPKVGVIATGSELTRRVENPLIGKVTETHGLVMSRMIESAGGVAEYIGIAKDEPADIKRRLRRALTSCDIVLTMAGTSLGGSDITADCINSLGRPGMLVHGVKIHRGRVMGFAAIRGKPVIILPGPIQGAVNAFLVFAYRLMMGSLGRGKTEPPKVYATLGSDWEAKQGFEDFAKVVYLKLGYSSDGFAATPVVGETEKMTVLTSSNAYALVPENVRSLKRGETIEAHLLPGFTFPDVGFID